MQLKDLSDDVIMYIIIDFCVEPFVCRETFYKYRQETRDKVVSRVLRENILLPFSDENIHKRIRIHMISVCLYHIRDKIYYATVFKCVSDKVSQEELSYINKSRNTLSYYSYDHKQPDSFYMECIYYYL